MSWSNIQLCLGLRSAFFSGAVGNLEDVEALETWEEHRGRVPPHLQQHPQHQDRQPAESRLPTASAPWYCQNLSPHLQPRGDAHACGRMLQRHAAWRRGGAGPAHAVRGKQQQMRAGERRKPVQSAVLRGSTGERGESHVRRENSMQEIVEPSALAQRCRSTPTEREELDSVVCWRGLPSDQCEEETEQSSLQPEKGRCAWGWCSSHAEGCINIFTRICHVR